MSKKEVVANIATGCNITFYFIQETHVNGNNKISIPGYYAFSRNRPKAGSKGGVAILVDEMFKDQCILIHEGQEAELIAVKVCNTVPNLVLVCYYGAQENTTSPATISNHISELVGLLTKQSEEGNMVVMAADMNVGIGNSVLVDNNPVVSRGGKLLNDLLEVNDDLILENVRYQGGSSRTHEDASGGSGKCLDMVICNTLADEKLSAFLVDETKVVTAYRYLAKSESKRFTDHYALYWEMDLRVFWDKKDLEPVYVWNYAKPLGDGRFAWHLDKSVPKLITCSNTNTNINTVLEKVHKEEDNARHRGYGRREIGVKSWDMLEDRRIELWRLEEVRKVVDKIREDRKNHTVPLQIFATRKTHLMAARGETFSSIIHPDTGKVVETRRGVSEATMRHNEKTLTQNEGQSECYKQLTEFKKKYIDWAKTVETDDPRDETIYIEEFLEVMKELQARNKNVYSDIKKWGPKFRIFVYWLMKRMYEDESIPDEFLTTNLQALYKNKGSRKDLGNYRFLHLKTCLAKMFETLVMRKVKPDLWKAFPTSQIGGLPGSRTTEHLYILVTLMLMIESKCEWSLEGCIIIYKDVRKAFDKVSAIHTLFAAALAGITGRNLRILEILNKITTFRVIGDSDGGEFVKEWVGGQGTVFTATACSQAMPEPMRRQIENHRDETGEHLGVTMGQDHVEIGEVDYVDDEGSIAKDAAAAREKGRMITRAMNELNVECHSTKTRFMILGTPAYKREMERQLAEEPIIIQGFEVERSENEKYLGMYIDAEGSKKTVRGQMEYRLKECWGKVAQIKGMMDKPTMREFGYLAGLRTLFDSIVTATALYSAGTWSGLRKADLEWFDREMKTMWYSLLRLNSRTTWLQVCWECDLLPWSWGIVREKINLISFLHHGKVGQSGQVAVSESSHNWKGGLVQEGRDWAEKLNLPDPAKVPLSTELVGERVREAARWEMWQSVVTSKYIQVEVTTERYIPDYFFMTELTNHEQLIWFSYRLGILEFRKRYSKKYSSVQCIYGCPDDDTLQHSKVCPENPVKFYSEDIHGMLDYLKKLNTERLNKVGVGVYWL